jgi:hypothetical protein
LIHEIDVPSSCGPEDTDFKAFVVETSLICSHNVVEEFLANGLGPLGHHFFIGGDDGVSTLHITMLMPQIDTTIKEREYGA